MKNRKARLDPAVIVDDPERLLALLDRPPASPVENDQHAPPVVDRPRDRDDAPHAPALRDNETALTTPKGAVVIRRRRAA